MHPNARTRQRFYTAFSQLDHATMAACYAPDATFEDEAFSLKGREQIGGMWRTCSAIKKPGRRALEAGVQRHRSRRQRRPRALGRRTTSSALPAARCTTSSTAPSPSHLTG